MSARAALPPIQIDRVLPDPGMMRDLLERGAPYAPVQRYFQNDAQYQALSGGAPPLIAPNFRGDWAYDEPRLAGVEPILHHAGFIDAARKIFSAAVVRPQQVYANLTWQLPFAQGAGHTDVPAFRGVDRTTVPTPLLSAMGHSGLFEDWRVSIATAVAWFYDGEDGGFEYWPEGPDAPSRVHEGRISNTAIVGDNDFMFHRVRPVGDRAEGIARGLSLDTRLEHLEGDGWAVREGDRVFGAPRFEELRVSVSWKAMVFETEDDARRYDERRDLLCLEQVYAIIDEDLARRGIDPSRGPEPLSDADWFGRVAGAYMATPPTA